MLIEPAAADLWVFGYGSLMWAPGFAYAECHPALLRGWHRALCILSIRNRGTPECPGLALGLDRGGACRGIAFRVAAGDVPAVRAYLWEREMSHRVYEDRILPVCLADGRRISALTFVAKRDHPQYVHGMPLSQVVRLVVQGRGEYGSAIDYLRQVVGHLDASGVRDGPLHAILRAAEQQYADAPSTSA